MLYASCRPHTSTNKRRTHIVFVGFPGGPIRNSWIESGFHGRNRFPVLVVSGVKNAAPVATGMDALGGRCSSCNARRVGMGRGGNSWSMSGTTPAGSQTSEPDREHRTHLKNRVLQTLPKCRDSMIVLAGNWPLPYPEGSLSMPLYQLCNVRQHRRGTDALFWEPSNLDKDRLS